MRQFTAGPAQTAAQELHATGVADLQGEQQEGAQGQQQGQQGNDVGGEGAGRNAREAAVATKGQ